MTFDRTLQPDPISYFESQDLVFKKGKPWGTTSCFSHGGSDSMRINTKTGAWVCMSCGTKGGDVLSYHMQAHGLEFVDAAKALGCWVDDGQAPVQHKPAPLPPRAALQVIGFEVLLIAVAAGNVAKGVRLTTQDLSRVLTAAGRITRLTEVYA